MVELQFCKNVVIKDLEFKNSPFWSIHPYACEDVTIKNVRVFNPPYSPNTDGIDLDSSKNVLIEDCLFRVGDDGISVKSGLNEAGREFGKQSENIVIKNITVQPGFDNLSTNGISIGSEMSGSIRNVSISNIRIHSCESGIYIKSMYGRGGVVEDVTVEGVTMERVLQAVRVSMDYMYRRRSLRSGDKGEDEGKSLVVA